MSDKPKLYNPITVSVANQLNSDKAIVAVVLAKIGLKNKDFRNKH